MGAEEQVGSTIGAFQAAALGDGTWTQALELLAEATGSRAGQLIGFGSQAALEFNWTNLPEECLREFAAQGWSDPALNPRVRAGIKVGELMALSEADFAPEPDRLPFYADFSRRWDLPFSCISNLLTREGLLIGMAVVRTRRQGPISARQQRIFEAVAPHARHAVRTRMMLSENAGALLAGAMESMELVAFVCRSDGRVLNRSPTADALLSTGGALSLRDGRLVGRSESCTRALTDAIARAGGSTGSRPTVPSLTPIHDVDGSCAFLAEVVPLPAGDRIFGFGAAVLVVLRTLRSKTADRIARTGVILFGLTPAEASIAADLSAGRAAQSIAQRRGVSVGTVRTQIRAIFEKTGVNSQIELVSLINARF